MDAFGDFVRPEKGAGGQKQQRSVEETCGISSGFTSDSAHDAAAETLRFHYSNEGLQNKTASHVQFGLCFWVLLLARLPEPVLICG